MRLLDANFRTVCLAGGFVLSCFAAAIAQQPKDEPPNEFLFRKFDEIQTLDWPDLMARLDNVAISFRGQRADALLYLVAYSGPRACAGQADRLSVRAKSYLVSKRGVASRGSKT